MLSIHIAKNKAVTRAERPHLDVRQGAGIVHISMYNMTERSFAKETHVSTLAFGGRAAL